LHRRRRTKPTRTSAKTLFILHQTVTSYEACFCGFYAVDHRAAAGGPDEASTEFYKGPSTIARFFFDAADGRAPDHHAHSRRSACKLDSLAEVITFGVHGR